MEKEPLKLLSDGITVLTPTARLSRHLQFQHSLMQLNAGYKSWQTPDCLPWAAWIRREWQEAQQKTGQNLYLLNDFQRLWLWQEIIRQSPEGSELLQSASTARQAIAAYDLCHTRNIEIFPGDQYLNEDARAFRGWVNHYRELLQQSAQLDEAGLVECLCHQYAHSDQSAKKIVLYGFADINPGQQKLIDSLRAANASVSILGVTQRNQSVRVCAAGNRTEEIRQLAHWSRQLLQADPGVTVGIICPQLQAMRQEFVHHLDNLLVPETLMTASVFEDKPYNIALGKPLSESPLVHTALNILRLGQQQIPLPVISQLLTSPFLRGFESELSRRACFDARLRELGEPVVTLKTVLRVADEYCRPYQQCRYFIDMLKAFDICYLSHTRNQKPGVWAQSFSKLLQQFNWPGERDLNSEEFQTLEAWKDMLEQLASLDNVCGQLTYGHALSQLLRIASETRFQPQTAEAPIQIMGTTAAAAMQFDYLWFMGCHDHAWPPVRQPNPFIPSALQREAGIPEASAELHLQQHRDLTLQIIRSAREAVISYPQQEEDRPLRASPVVNMFAGQAKPFPLHTANDYQQEILASGRLEAFLDEKAPEMLSNQSTTGGSGIFKDQALCPFRAFARHRLHARPLRSVDAGLSPVDRGLLVHEAMQNFWIHDRGSESLVDVDEQQLFKRIDRAVQQAIKTFSQQKPETLTDNFIKLEQYRLSRLLQEWVNIEKKREPFVVKEVEQWHAVEFAGIKIQMRIDRIDELADSRLIIIDYKTGHVSVNDWLDERPADPQLPLYALTTEGEVAAIAYGKVKRGECKYLGLAEEDNLLPAVKSPLSTGWQEQVLNWERILSSLAKEFLEGFAAVMPRDSKACNQCDLHGFCRIYERIEFANGEEPDE